jgi:hypothetical protein
MEGSLKMVVGLMFGGSLFISHDLGFGLMLMAPFML